MRKSALEWTETSKIMQILVSNSRFKIQPNIVQYIPWILWYQAISSALSLNSWVNFWVVLEKSKLMGQWPCNPQRGVTNWYYWQVERGKTFKTTLNLTETVQLCYVGYILVILKISCAKGVITPKILTDPFSGWKTFWHLSNVNCSFCAHLHSIGFWEEVTRLFVFVIF